MTEDFYSILGVAQDATSVAIKQAFRRKARELHPDAGGSPEAFSRLKAAFDCLVDPVRRAQYDRSGAREALERHRSEEKLSALFSFALDQTLLKLN